MYAPAAAPLRAGRPQSDQAWLWSLDGRSYGLVNSSLAAPPQMQDSAGWWIHVMAVAIRALILPPENARALDAAAADWDGMFEELHSLDREPVALVVDGSTLDGEALVYAGVRFALASDYSRCPVVQARPAGSTGPWPALVTL